MITILENAISPKSVSVIEYLCRRCSNDIIKILTNKESEEVKKQTAKNILNNVEELVKKAVEAKDVSTLSFYVNVIEASLIRDPSEENLSIVKRIQEVVDNFIEEQGKAWGCYPGTSPAYNIYAATKYVKGYIFNEDYQKVKHIKGNLNRTVISLSNLVAASNVEPKGASSKQVKDNGCNRSRSTVK